MTRLLPGSKPVTIVLFLLAALAIVALGCGRTTASGEPDNFRGVKWGADYSSLSGFNQIAVKGDLAFYERQSDSLQVEDIRLDQVVYGFYKGRFYTAMVYFPTSSFARMKTVLAAKLGEPIQPDKSPSNLAWDGTDVTVLLTEGSSGNEQARLAYLYKPIQLDVELKK